MTGTARSQVFTFYSYKGGTGRSMLLANAAVMLAACGYRTLIIDWDLEAPGLHRYFAPFLDDPELTRSKGIIDWINDYCDAAIEDWQEPRDARWYRANVDLEGYLQELRLPAKRSGCVRFVGAGKQGGAYGEKVSLFDWRQLFTKFDGRNFFRTARKEWSKDYDYILIDSRTGVTDTSGICTTELPDKLVVCFTYNNQSIRGAAHVADQCLQVWEAEDRERDRADLRKRSVVPIATRVDQFAPEKVTERRNYASSLFARSLASQGESDPEGYWGKMSVPYAPFYSYEELLPVFLESPRDDSSILRPMRNLVAKLVDDPQLEVMLELPAGERRRIQAAYRGSSSMVSEARQEVDAVSTLRSSIGEDGLSEFLHRHWTALARLIAVSEGQPVSCWVPAIEFVQLQRSLDELFRHGLALSGFDRVQGQRSVSLYSDAIFKAWPELSNKALSWQTELEALQRLYSARRQWEASLYAPSHLLGKRELDEVQVLVSDLASRSASHLLLTEQSFLKRSEEAVASKLQFEAELEHRQKLQQELAESQARERSVLSQHKQDRERLLELSASLDQRIEQRSFRWKSAVIGLLAAIIGIAFFAWDERRDARTAAVNAQQELAIARMRARHLEGHERLRARDFGAAKAAFTDAIDSARTVGSQVKPETLAEMLAERAECSVSLGEIEQARRDLQEALKYIPESVPALIALAQIMERDKNTHLAVDYYSRAVRFTTNPLLVERAVSGIRRITTDVDAATRILLVPRLSRREDVDRIVASLRTLPYALAVIDLEVPSQLVKPASLPVLARVKIQYTDEKARGAAIKVGENLKAASESVSEQSLAPADFIVEKVLRYPTTGRQRSLGLGAEQAVHPLDVVVDIFFRDVEQSSASPPR
jgi:tetratricopeptide (TPR) repeat protein